MSETLRVTTSSENILGMEFVHSVEDYNPEESVTYTRREMIDMLQSAHNAGANGVSMYTKTINRKNKPK